MKEGKSSDPTEFIDASGWHEVRGFPNPWVPDRSFRTGLGDPKTHGILSRSLMCCSLMIATRTNRDAQIQASRTVFSFQVGDRVKIKHYDDSIVEARGALGPGGALVFGVMVPRTPEPAYIELRADQLIPVGDQKQTLDVTGLSLKAIRALETLIDLLRANLGALPTPSPSVFDLFRRAPRLRSTEDIAKQTDEERKAWDRS